MNSKKISIIILAIIAVLGATALVYWQWQKQQKTELSPEEAELKMLQLDLIDSPMEKVITPDTDLTITDNLWGEFNVHLPNLSLEQIIDIKVPQVEINF